MLRAASELARTLDDDWKAGNLLQYDKQGTLMAMAPLSGFDDWLTLRDRLNRATAVRAYESGRAVEDRGGAGVALCRRAGPTGIDADAERLWC
jgi:hypothetical protein